MGKLCASLVGAILTLASAIIIAKAQSQPKIWYGWILTDPRVVPGLLVLSALLFLLALGQNSRIASLYWSIFSRLIPKPKSTKDEPLTNTHEDELRVREQKNRSLKERTEQQNIPEGNFRIRGQLPRISGSFFTIKIVRFGLITENRQDKQQWAMCGFSMQVSLSASDSVRIKEIKLATHANKPPCRPMRRIADPQVSELNANNSPIFEVSPQIEYLYDGVKSLPSSLEMIVTDEFEAEHHIQLRTGEELPNLPI
jgi:hypothetical protein